MRAEEFYRREWMSDDQWECNIFLADLFYGFHRIRGAIKPCGTGIEINTRNSNWCGTYDFDGLTRAVFMAHDRMIRFGIEPSGPGLLKLHLHKRHKREGRMYERHPTIDDALKKWKNGNSIGG